MDPDAGISHREGNHLFSAVQRFKVILLIGRRRFDSHHHVAFFRKLESVRQQVHQDLLQTLVVGDQRWFKVRAALDEEAKLLVLRDLMEAALELLSDIVERDIRNLDPHHSRFNLR